MPSLRLTQTEVKKLEGTPGKQVLFRDAEAPGLALRITPNGHKTFVFGYSLHGHERRMRISDTATCTLAEAREAAKKLRREVDNGVDPLEKRDAIAAAPTVKQLWTDYQRDHFPDISEKHRKEQVAYWDRHIIPALGNKKVSAVTRLDVLNLHRKISQAAPILANRVLASIRRAFSYALSRELVKVNVATNIKQNREKARRRYLTPDEMARLVAALGRMTNRQAANAITLLALTGARRSEVLGARWDEFEIPAAGDQPPARWRKPAERTKSRTESSTALSDAAVTLLQQMRAEAADQSEYLFPTKGGTPIPDVNKPWNWLRKEADLDDFRMHDLRHSFASLLISSGYSLAAVGEMLGHSQPQTTARYAHLMDAPQKAAAELVGAAWKAAAGDQDHSQS
ncbi:tyrosine-type recombinase/integrase [Jannaschia formosa]|uniref:tyrosine-type recombinase/integrase n=1 Tax=Jannaschia formosa TaxID=2259592 RepID=UPI000E1B8544|nr:site-specific integrase [Jannaschia formosa]TFL20268.1 DUF4102 domain-containing protein [Jannaschia formosa]